ncbi:hypothetical protein D3C87_03280 [compost metagenome]
MKNHYLSLAAIFLSAVFNSFHAQEGGLKFKNPFENASKHTSFGAMAAIPVGKFSSTSIDNGGFAKTGWGLYFDSKSTLKKGLSFVSHSTYSWVPMDQQALEKAFSDNLGRKTEINGGKHRPFMTTLGVGYDFHLGSKISAAVSAQGGFMYNSAKGFDMTVYDTDNTTVLFSDNFKYDSEFSFAYTFSAQLNFNIVKDVVSFQVYCDYSGSQYNSPIRSYHLPTIKTSQSIQLVNVGGGFCIKTK